MNYRDAIKWVLSYSKTIGVTRLAKECGIHRNNRAFSRALDGLVADGVVEVVQADPFARKQYRLKPEALK